MSSNLHICLQFVFSGTETQHLYPLNSSILTYWKNTGKMGVESRLYSHVVVIKTQVTPIDLVITGTNQVNRFCNTNLKSKLNP